MTKYMLAAAAVAAIALSGAAFAEEAKHPTKSAAPLAMSDTELDKVTAGFGFVEVPEAAFEHGFLVNQIGDPNQKARERAEQPVLRN